MKTKKARGVLLDALERSYGFERKYLGKLLRGERGYRPRRGRGASYTEGSKELVVELWKAAGRPAAEYLEPMMGKLVEEWRELCGEAGEEEVEQVKKMSASTLGRAVRGRGGGRAKGRRNKRSGAGGALRRAIPQMPGSHLPEDAVGTCQVDTVHLSGGGTYGSHFNVATLTDALTQWFECAPAWNHGAAATAAAMEAIHARLPFAVLHLHPDNGPEFINLLFARAMARLDPAIGLSSSRPYALNDNCRIEQKNGSVVRDYFGDQRFDDHSQLAALQGLCRDIALYTNLFRPCKKLASKRRKKGKGVKYHKTYDAPRTPLQRLADHLPSDTPALQAYQRLHALTNSIALLKSIQTRLRALVRTMHSQRPRAAAAAPPPQC